MISVAIALDTQVICRTICRANSQIDPLAGYPDLRIDLVPPRLEGATYRLLERRLRLAVRRKDDLPLEGTNGVLRVLQVAT